MNKGALFLGLAILWGLLGTTMIKLSEGFTNLVPSIVFIVSYIASFIFFGLSLKTIPLSTAYAIWSGLGTALTFAIGVVFFQEALSNVNVLALILIITGVVMLNQSTDDVQQQVSGK